MQIVGSFVQIENCSEVARLKEQLDAECESARAALYGYAEVAKHERITAHMENMGRLHDKLRDQVGEEEAARLLVKSMER
jgi:hypothetical protein